MVTIPTKAKCLSYCETSDRCSLCKSVFVDWKDVIQGMVDEADVRISAGQWIMGRNISLDKNHIKRISTALQREIDIIMAGIPCCEAFSFREGWRRNEPLFPSREMRCLLT